MSFNTFVILVGLGAIISFLIVELERRRGE